MLIKVELEQEGESWMEEAGRVGSRRERWALNFSATPGLPAYVKYCVRQYRYNTTGTVSAKDLT